MFVLVLLLDLEIDPHFSSTEKSFWDVTEFIFNFEHNERRRYPITSEVSGKNSPLSEEEARVDAKTLEQLEKEYLANLIQI